jgi:hypothetical protein
MFLRYSPQPEGIEGRSVYRAAARIPKNAAAYKNNFFQREPNKRKSA